MTDAADWRGGVGRVWADEWRRTERAFAGIAAVLDDALRTVAPIAGRALDIGCGVGSTALALADARPGLDIVGADLSEALVAVAAERAASRVHVVAGDAIGIAATLAPLDLLLSRHGVMFFADPVAAFARLAAAASDDAPLVFTCFRARAENDWATLVDGAVGVVPPVGSVEPGPFAFADAERVTTMLSAAGWTGIGAEAHDVAYMLGDDVDDALAFCRRIGPAARVLAQAAPAERARIEARLADRLAATRNDGPVAPRAAIWLWTARKDSK